MLRWNDVSWWSNNNDSDDSTQEIGFGNNIKQLFLLLFKKALS